MNISKTGYIFTMNDKTVLSIDFPREETCPQICSYCYVEKAEKFRKTYLPKLERNHQMFLDNPVEFAHALNAEYNYARKSKAKQFIGLEKLPVRMYGSGDFIPEHIEFLRELDFKFFIISKSLTFESMVKYIDKLFELENLTNITLSFDTENIWNYGNIKEYVDHDKTNVAFTGLVDDMLKWKDVGMKFGIFFNTKKTRAEELKTRATKEQCPCDSKLMPRMKVCTKCNKCWRSSTTKQKGWNNYVSA